MNNITPDAQMILTETSTLIFHPDSRKKQSTPFHRKGSTKLGGHGERKRSLGSHRTPAAASSSSYAGMHLPPSVPIRQVHVQKSPYVSQETAILLKQHMQRRLGSNRSFQTQSSAALQGLPLHPNSKAIARASPKPLRGSKGTNMSKR